VVQPCSFVPPHDGRVARVRVEFERIEVPNYSCTERIEVNVADQFEKVWFLFTEDGFVAVLEEMAGSFVTPVERDGIAGQEATHDAGNGRNARPKEEMDVIREKGEGIAGGFSFTEHHGSTLDEPLPVNVIIEDGTSHNAPDHHVVQCSRSVDAGMSGHNEMVSGEEMWCQDKLII
jgi:hypothetical protein